MTREQAQDIAMRLDTILEAVVELDFAGSLDSGVVGVLIQEAKQKSKALYVGLDAVKFEQEEAA